MHVNIPTLIPPPFPPLIPSPIPPPLRRNKSRGGKAKKAACEKVGENATEKERERGTERETYLREPFCVYTYYIHTLLHAFVVAHNIVPCSWQFLCNIRLDRLNFLFG